MEPGICGDFKKSQFTLCYLLSSVRYHTDYLFAGCLAGGQKFRKINLCQAYLQMHMDEYSKDPLTVVTHKELFRYSRLPFGITSTPALFQILNGLPGEQHYLHDILITGKDQEDHLENLDVTLQILKDYRLRVRNDKMCILPIIG